MKTEWRPSLARRLASLRETAYGPNDDQCKEEVLDRLRQLELIARQDRAAYEGDPRDPDFASRWYEAETAYLAKDRLARWIEEVSRKSPNAPVMKAALQFLVERDAAPSSPISQTVPKASQVEEAWEHADRVHPAGEAARQLLTHNKKAADLASWLALVKQVLRSGEHLPATEGEALADYLDSIAAHSDAEQSKWNVRHSAMVEEYLQVQSDALALYVEELRSLQRQHGLPIHMDGDWIPTPEEMADERRGQCITIRAGHLLWIDRVVASGRFPNARAARAHLGRLQAHYVAEFGRNRGCQ